MRPARGFFTGWRVDRGAAAIAHFLTREVWGMKRFGWAMGCAAVVLFAFYFFNRQDPSFAPPPPPTSPAADARPAPPAASAARSTPLPATTPLPSKAAPSPRSALPAKPVAMRDFLDIPLSFGLEESSVAEAMAQLSLEIAGRATVRFEVSAEAAGSVNLPRQTRTLREALDEICRINRLQWELTGEDTIQITPRRIGF